MFHSIFIVYLDVCILVLVYNIPRIFGFDRKINNSFENKSKDFYKWHIFVNKSAHPIEWDKDSTLI